MKDLFQCEICRDDFQQWLAWGNAPMTIWQGEKAVTVLTSLEKSSSVDYLYRAAVKQDGGISWDNSLVFCGVYNRQRRDLYLTKDSLSCLTVGAFPFASETGLSVLEEICGGINQQVEAVIANDWNNLDVREVTGWRASRDLKEYLDYGAQNEALERFFRDSAPDGQFHSGYALDELPETAFTAWLQNPEGFIKSEAKQYIKKNQERFLLDFMKRDALMEKYLALVQDAENPIHRTKAITKAIKVSGAKTVTVTVQKDGQELTFKTDADSLIGHRNFYNTSRISAPDRRKFERMFGRGADYSAVDITKITYGRNTIYEAPPVQVEDMAGEHKPPMEMGGMSL